MINAAETVGAMTPASDCRADPLSDEDHETGTRVTGAGWTFVAKAGTSKLPPHYTSKSLYWRGTSANDQSYMGVCW